MLKKATIILVERRRDRSRQQHLVRPMSPEYRVTYVSGRINHTRARRYAWIL